MKHIHKKQSHESRTLHLDKVWSWRGVWMNEWRGSHLNEVAEQRAGEFLSDDLPVVLAAIAAGDQGGEEDSDQARVAEVLEGQRAQLLQHAGGLSALDDHLERR